MKRRLALIVVMGVLIVLALNLTELLRYPGGPLREPSADGLLWLDTRPPNQGSNQVGLSSIGGVAAGTTLYTGISIHNDSGFPATVENVRLLAATPGLQLRRVRMALPGTSGGMAGLLYGDNIDELRLDTDYGSLPAALAANNDPGEGRISIEVAADQPGEFGYEAVAVDYRIGPFSFTAVYHDALNVCLVPLPVVTTCSNDVSERNPSSPGRS
jgi:hypothetical protein